MTITSIQMETLEHIDEFISTNRYSPTIRELMDMANLKSPAPIQSRLQHLLNNEYITWVPGLSRTIHLTDKANELLTVSV